MVEDGLLVSIEPLGKLPSRLVGISFDRDLQQAIVDARESPEARSVFEVDVTGLEISKPAIDRSFRHGAVTECFIDAAL